MSRERRTRDRRRNRNRDESAPPASGRGTAWLAGLVGLAWGAFVVFLLLRPGSPFTTEPLAFSSWENLAVPAQPRNEPHALRLAAAVGPEGRTEHRLALDLPRYDGPRGRIDGASFVPDPELREDALRSVGFYFEREAGADAPLQGDDPLEILSGELRLPGGRVFGLLNPGGARRGRLVEFGEMPGRATNSGPAGLRIVTAGRGPLFVRGVMRPLANGATESRTAPLGRLVARLGTNDAPQTAVPVELLFYPDGRCTYPLPGNPPSRLALVAAVHQVSPGFVLGVVIVSGLLVAAGLAGIGRAVEAEAGVGGVLGAAVGSLVAGFALVAGLVVAPFHGPDETRHVISYARLVRNDAVLTELFSVGRRTHFDSVRWRPDEKLSLPRMAEFAGFFINTTTLRPGLVEDFFQDYRRRAPAMARLWTVASWVLPDTSGPTVALGLRWLHGALGAVLLGWGAALLGSGLPRGGARWVVLWPLLLLPLVPLLTAVSNYALLVASAGLATACLLRLALRFEDDPSVAGATGFGLGLMLQSSINAVPFLIGAAVWLGHRPLLRWLGSGADSDDEPVRPGRWWFLLAAGFAGARLLSGPVVGPEFWKEGAAKLGLASHPAWVDPVLFWCLYCAGGAFLDAIASTRPATGLARAVSGGLERLSVVGWPVAVIVAGVAVWFTVSTPVALPDLDQPWRQFTGIPSTGMPVRTVEERGVPVPVISRGEQVREILRVVTTNLSFRPRDFVLIRTFWGGLLGGEVRVPGWAMDFGSGCVVLGLAAGALALAAAGSSRRTLVAALGVVAWTTALALLAAVYWPRNLIGRYATPLLLVLLATAVLGWVPALRAAGERHPRWVTLAAVLTVLMGPCTWAACLLDRFY